MTGESPKARPIVFLGPSIRESDARRVLEAEYRPPIRRGDLDPIGGGAVVGIIDGVFDHSLAISPRELCEALLRGVRVLGSSSMGALRAAEVPGVEGVGRVYQMYRDGVVEDDDEVALTFCADTFRPLSEPMVNVRHAIERLVRPGTLDPATGERIVRAAKRLHYSERTYPRILAEAGFERGVEADKLASMLRIHDLKREDALVLLEALRLARPHPVRDAPRRVGADEVAPPGELAADAPVLFWEFGESIAFRDLVRFLKLTGDFAAIARNAVARFILQGNELAVPSVRDDPGPASAERLEAVRRAWGWVAAEEFAVTMNDIGLSLDALSDGILEEVEGTARLMALAREESDEFLRAIRTEMVLDDLALKRAAVRLGSLERFAAAGRRGGPLTDTERQAAWRKLCALQHTISPTRARALLGRWGVAADQVDVFVEVLGHARRAGRRVLDALDGQARVRRARVDIEAALRRAGLRRRKKADGSRRFHLPIAQALREATRLRPVVGIQRVAMVTGLSPIPLPNAQAYRPDGTWSSTVGGGKGETASGAKVGAIMEEIEKWCQERFSPEIEVVASYRALARRRRDVFDPARLALPHDSCYSPDDEIGWVRVHDLIGGRPTLIPAALFDTARHLHDVLYSVRGGRKTLDSNGLASGFSLEEAVLHATCEVIERHACVLAEILWKNPGDRVPVAYPLLDLRTAPASSRRLVAKIARAGYRIQVLDVTSEVAVPTFWSVIYDEVAPVFTRFGDDAREARGTAAHPDPQVALDMAICEAVQTVAANIAGSREDLTIRVRSLGRHERSAASRRHGHVYGRTFDEPVRPFDAGGGLVVRDIFAELAWVVERLAAAGLEHLFVADLSRPEVAPVRAVRVVVPGLESINPFSTGDRARAALLRDLLPGRTP